MPTCHRYSWKGSPLPSDETWRVIADQSEYAKQAADERFIHLLALARCVNALRFSASVLTPVQGHDRQAAVRTRINSFLHTAAILFEGGRLAESLARHFRTDPAFALMAELLADRDVTTLFAETLKPVRDGFVFHYGPENIREALERNEEDEPVFVLGRGDQAYYQLADLVVVRTMIQTPQSEAERDASYAEVLKAVADLGVRFARAADRLIAPVLLQMGWRMVSR